MCAVPPIGYISDVKIDFEGEFKNSFFFLLAENVEKCQFEQLTVVFCSAIALWALKWSICLRNAVIYQRK